MEGPFVAQLLQGACRLGQHAPPLAWSQKQRRGEVGAGQLQGFCLFPGGGAALLLTSWEGRKRGNHRKQVDTPVWCEFRPPRCICGTHRWVLAFSNPHAHPQKTRWSLQGLTSFGSRRSSPAEASVKQLVGPSGAGSGHQSGSCLMEEDLEEEVEKLTPTTAFSPPPPVGQS